MPAELPLLLKIPDVCREIGCSRATVYRLLDRGELVGFKDGARRRVTRESVLRYVNRHSRRARGLRTLGGDDAG